TTKSLEVIDLRKNKEMKDIVFRGKYYSFSFPTDDLSEDIKNWFEKNNRKRNKATNDIVLLIEDLAISNDIRNKEIYCVLNMKFSTFLRKDGGLYFLKRYDNVIGLNTKEVPGIPNTFVENTQKVLQKLMFDSYRATPFETKIPAADLYKYDEILKTNYSAFSNNELKDGIYLDYQSFFSQAPIENYQIIKNNGEVIKAVNTADDKIPARKIYGYVENGKAFKNTQAGFLELQKNEKGFFVMANKYILFPEEINVSSAYFLFGAVGGIASGIELYAKYNKALKADRDPIYIDFLNGEYSFVK
ncbi:hypothetical protein, partial [Kaistella sp.]|uniref:hypothetical protein n=1 Tax=Kaistella sp. TaxID=2782235 RepID=UPI003C671091